jgi:hypothetical protein
MATVLKIGNRMFTAEEIVPLLASYRLIPQFLCESIVDEAITSIRCTVEEVTRFINSGDWFLKNKGKLGELIMV